MLSTLDSTSTIIINLNPTWGRSYTVLGFCEHYFAAVSQNPMAKEPAAGVQPMAKPARSSIEPGWSIEGLIGRADTETEILSGILSGILKLRPPAAPMGPVPGRPLKSSRGERNRSTDKDGRKNRFTQSATGAVRQPGRNFRRWRIVPFCYHLSCRSSASRKEFFAT